VADRIQVNALRPRPTVKRGTDRQAVAVPGRLTWKDARGMTRFASVVTRDISDEGVYLDCRAGDAIPLHRLVYLQLEREARDAAQLPPVLREGRVLSAVYRVGPCEASTGTPKGYALRLLNTPSKAKAAAAPAPLALAN